MNRLTRLSVIAAAVLMSAVPAIAADMGVPYVPEARYGGWYLRGDIGFSNQSVGSLYNVLYDTTDVTHVFANFDAAPFGGVGVGYMFNNYFRVDFTGEYRGAAAFHGLDTYPFDDGGTQVTRIDEYEGSKSEWTFLGNVYVDFAHFHGIVPFIGAGIGASRNTISNFTDTDPTSGDTFGPSFATGATASTWNFAWAVYAGLGYQVNEKLTLEAAYRYINLGNAVTGDLIAYDGTNTIVNPMHFNNLTSNDFKLGFRYSLN